jgi:ABC-type lipoprotein release transport system permease subunit
VRLWSRRGATVALAVLVGLCSGVVMAAVAGASRTDSAMGRFVTYSRPEDVVAIVNGVQGDPNDPAVQRAVATVRARVLALPEVVRAGRAPFVFLSADPRGRDVGVINPFAGADRNMFRTIERARLLDGRLPRPERLDEAVIDDVTASRRSLHVGSRVRMWAFAGSQMGDPSSTVLSKYPVPAGPSYEFRIVGIVRTPGGVNAPPASVAEDAVYDGVGELHLTPAFLRRYTADQGIPEEALPGMEIFRVRLRHGLADVKAFQQSVARVVGPGDGRVFVNSTARDAQTETSKAIHLETIGLLVFAGLAGLATFLMVGQVLARQVTADAVDHRKLSALGMVRRELVLVSLARVVLEAVGGAVIAVVVAFLLSPLTPIGLARRAEIHPGFSFNVAVVVIGFGVVVAAFVLRGLVTAWRTATALHRDLNPRPARLSSLRRLAVAFGLGAAAFAGLSMSVGRRRGTAFRAALLATIVAVTGVTAALTFRGSLEHLLDSPREQGWNWDVFVGNPNAAEAFTGDPDASVFQTRMTQLLTANHNVGAFSAVALADAAVDGYRVGVAGIEPLRGAVGPVVVNGRAPRSRSEIALGHRLLTRLQKRVGDTVTLSIGDRRAKMRVVGEALQPTAGGLTAQLSEGALTTIPGLRRVEPDAIAFQFAVRYTPGVNHTAALDSLVHDFGREVLQPFPGGEVGNLAHVDALPYVLAALLAALGAATVALMLLASVRTHRHDFAVLETLGFVRRQSAATVSWQASILAIIGAIVGVPCGVALGRWTWRLVADNVGSGSPAIVSLVLVLVAVPASIVATNVLATGAASAARRVRPAQALRAE